MRALRPGLLPVQRRHDLRRRPDRRRRVALPDGSIWRNVTTEEKSKVAETLAEFRGNFRYNLLDENLQRLQRPGPVDRPVGRPRGHQQLVPGRDPRPTPGTPRRASTCSPPAPGGPSASTSRSPRCAPGAREGRVHRVMRHGPLLDVFVLDMRTYRNANSPGTPDRPTRSGILGAEQLEWLKRELSRSRAVWKVIAADMPLGLVVPDTGDGKPNIEAVAQGDPGAPLGPGAADRRAAAVHQAPADHRHGVADGRRALHLGAALRSPSRAAFTDFEPFWEFVSGPLNAGAFPANALDDTFGPERVFVKAPTARERVAGGRLPVLRRGRHRRRQRGADGTAARAGRDRAVHEGAAAGARRTVTGAVQRRPAVAFPQVRVDCQWSLLPFSHDAILAGRGLHPTLRAGVRGGRTPAGAGDLAGVRPRRGTRPIPGSSRAS